MREHGVTVVINASKAMWKLQKAAFKIGKICLFVHRLFAEVHYRPNGVGAGSVMRAVSLRVCLMINGVALQRLEPF